VDSDIVGAAEVGEDLLRRCQEASPLVRRDVDVSEGEGRGASEEAVRRAQPRDGPVDGIEDLGGADGPSPLASMRARVFSSNSRPVEGQARATQSFWSRWRRATRSAPVSMRTWSNPPTRKKEKV